MIRRYRLLAACFCLALLWTAGPVRAETAQVFAHLLVVPLALPDGSDAAQRTADFEAWLIESFGGYTRLGLGSGGWKNEAGQPETEANATYLTTASRDASKEIAARMVQDFGMRVPYVLVFPAGAFVTRPKVR